jgi:hypothetical protein
MGASHENCEHPRTPAGRAWCRANGGPGSGAVWGSLADNEPTMKAARAGKLGKPYVVAVPAPDQDAVQRQLDNALGVTTKPRKRTSSKVSIADLPRIFRTAVDWATDNGLTVEPRDGRNDSVLVQITNPATGILTLTYSRATPDGVHAVSFRPNGTSITSRVTNVNEGLAKVKG